MNPNPQATAEACLDSALLADLAGGRDLGLDLEPIAEHLQACPACRDRFDQRLRQDLHRTEVPLSHPAQPGEAPEGLPGPRENRRAYARIGTRFQVLANLGHGGMGEVFKCFDNQLNRIVAVKMIRQDRLSARLLDRLDREARIQAGLNHPNIIPIYEVGHWEGMPLIAMEFMGGGSLRELIREKPLDAREAALLLAPIAQALAHAHAQNVLHRDLKPSNILLTSAAPHGDTADPHPAVPKIADFGLAKILGEQTDLSQSEVVVGTPAYLAPELCGLNNNQWSPASDIYSFGVVLYESLTGHPPFNANSVGQLMAMIQSFTPVSPRTLVSGISRDLETICLKCLEKEPAKRYPTAQAMARDLQCFIERKPIQARPIGRIPKAWRWCRRNRAVAAALGVAAVSLAALVAGSINFAYAQARLRGIAETNGKLAQMQSQQARAAEREARQQRDMARSLFVISSNVLHNIGNTLAISQFAPNPAAELKNVNRLFHQQVLALSEDYLKRPDLAADSPDLLPRSLYNAARAHRELGQSAEAIRHYEWLLELVRSSPVPRPGDESYRFLGTNAVVDLAMLYDDTGQPARAIALLEPLWLNPVNPQTNQPYSSQNTDHARIRSLAGSKLHPLYLKTGQAEKARIVQEELIRLATSLTHKP